jgi:hypothetical protein
MFYRGRFFQFHAGKKLTMAVSEKWGGDEQYCYS